MAYSLITSVIAGSGDTFNVTTGNVTSTGADLIVLVLASFSTGSFIQVSDSNTNTWNTLTTYTTSTLPRITIFYAKGTLNVGSGHNFTATSVGGPNYPTLAALVFSGATTNPFDQENGANYDAASTTANTGNITPTENNELIVTGVGGQNANAGLTLSGFTVDQQVTIVGGTYWGLAVAHQIQTTATTVAGGWSGLSSGAYASAIASFKAAATAAGNPWYAYAQQ